MLQTCFTVQFSVLISKCSQSYLRFMINAIVVNSFLKLGKGYLYFYWRYYKTVEPFIITFTICNQSLLSEYIPSMQFKVILKLIMCNDIYWPISYDKQSVIKQKVIPKNVCKWIWMIRLHKIFSIGIWYYIGLT